MKKLLSVIFLILFVSCNPVDKTYSISQLFKDLPIYNLEGEKMSVDPLMVLAFDFNEDFMVVRGSGSEYFYHLYDIRTGEKIQDFLKVGNGPNEANMAMDFVLTAHNQMYLSTSNGRQELFVYDLGAGSTQEPILPKEVIKIDSFVTKSFSRLYMTSDSILIGRPTYNKDNDNKMLFIRAMKTKKESSAVNFPYSDCNNEINPLALSAAYQGDLCLSSNEKTMAITSSAAEYLSFYHRDGIDLKLSKEYLYTSAFFKTTPDNWYINSRDKSYFYITDLSQSDGKYYALYYGVTFDDYTAMMSGKKENTGTIYVFDDLGEPLYSIKIQNPKAFINVRAEKLIALTVGEDIEDCFYVYDLSKLPK